MPVRTLPRRWMLRDLRYELKLYPNVPSDLARWDPKFGSPAWSASGIVGDRAVGLIDCLSDSDDIYFRFRWHDQLVEQGGPLHRRGNHPRPQPPSVPSLIAPVGGLVTLGVIYHGHLEPWIEAVIDLRVVVEVP